MKTQIKYTTKVKRRFILGKYSVKVNDKVSSTKLHSFTKYNANINIVELKDNIDQT